MQETVLKINLENLRSNAKAFKKHTDRFLYAVVKADAYGHGALMVTNALYEIADGFAVALVSEALAIRQAARGKEVLIFTPPMTEEDVVLSANNGFTLSVTDLKSAALIVKTAKKYGLTVDTQVKINTGMNRYGVYGSTLGRVCSILKKSGQVRVQGVYSHLYSHQRALCEEQRLRFLHAVKVCRTYFPLARAHLASTFGSTLGEEYLFDGVRIGLGLYGYFPAEECETTLSLQPVMSAYATCVAQRKCLFGGAGYGENRPELYGKKISVLRGGYADGFGVSAEAGLLPSGLGDFCMDVCVTDGLAKVGESVCMFSDAKKVASARNTSVYEVLCLMGLRAEKIYKND